MTTWSFAPRYDERWWENNLRSGLGVRWYPFAHGPKGGFRNGLRERFHVFAEQIWQVAGEDLPDDVEDSDFRIGVGFSTQGFFREE